MVCKLERLQLLECQGSKCIFSRTWIFQWEPSLVTMEPSLCSFLVSNTNRSIAPQKAILLWTHLFYWTNEKQSAIIADTGVGIERLHIYFRGNRREIDESPQNYPGTWGKGVKGTFFFFVDFPLGDFCLIVHSIVLLNCEWGCGYCILGSFWMYGGNLFYNFLVIFYFHILHSQIFPFYLCATAFSHCGWRCGDFIPRSKVWKASRNSSSGTVSASFRVTKSQHSTADQWHILNNLNILNNGTQIRKKIIQWGNKKKQFWGSLCGKGSDSNLWSKSHSNPHSGATNTDIFIHDDHFNAMPLRRPFSCELVCQ